MTIYTDKPPINRLRGVIPTADTFDTNPSNLERCTDGDWNNPTGTGTKTTVAAGNIGRLFFDLGRVYNFHLRLKVGMWRDAGSLHLYIYHSEDGVTYRAASERPIATSAAAAEQIRFCHIEFVRTRYLRLDFYGTVAMTGNVKIYEVEALDLGL